MYVPLCGSRSGPSQLPWFCGLQVSTLKSRNWPSPLQTVVELLHPALAPGCTEMVSVAISVGQGACPGTRYSYTPCTSMLGSKVALWFWLLKNQDPPVFGLPVSKLNMLKAAPFEQIVVNPLLPAFAS